MCVCVCVRVRACVCACEYIRFWEKGEIKGSSHDTRRDTYGILFSIVKVNGLGPSHIQVGIPNFVVGTTAAHGAIHVLGIVVHGIRESDCFVLIGRKHVCLPVLELNDRRGVVLALCCYYY